MYRMNHYTITAPHVRNDGTRSDYAEALRDALLDHGIDGWTEHESAGCWHGKLESGTVFTLYRMPSVATPTEVAEILGGLARRAMPDQEAVQVTYHGSILLIEA